VVARPSTVPTILSTAPTADSCLVRRISALPTAARSLGPVTDQGQYPNHDVDEWRDLAIS
jgi:hypothetical protein